MFGGFQVGPFQPLPAYQQEAAGAVVIVGSGVRRRKLRILPNGKRIFSTEQEAIDALLLYYHEQKLKPIEAALLGLPPNRKKKVIILPTEHKDIEEAIATIQYEATNAARRERLLKQRRQEEEWLLLFH